MQENIEKEIQDLSNYIAQSELDLKKDKEKIDSKVCITSADRYDKYVKEKMHRSDVRITNSKNAVMCAKLLVKILVNKENIYGTTRFSVIKDAIKLISEELKNYDLPNKNSADAIIDDPFKYISASEFSGIIAGMESLLMYSNAAPNIICENAIKSFNQSAVTPDELVESVGGRIVSNEKVDTKEKDSSIKRDKVISWDECFMKLAQVVALRSKDPSTQVGACIVDPNDHRIKSLGYNGFPFHCSDDEFSWSKDDENDNKYLYVVHAELNAILSAGRDLSGDTLYVTHFPCNECMKAVIQAGIKEIVYFNEYKPGQPIAIASNKMATAAGIKIRRYVPE